MHMLRSALLVAAVLAVPADAMEDYTVGLAEARIGDAGDGRPIELRVWYPAKPGGKPALIADMRVGPAITPSC